MNKLNALFPGEVRINDRDKNMIEVENKRLKQEIEKLREQRSMAQEKIHLINDILTGRKTRVSGLFQYGDFKTRSGERSKFKIECDALAELDFRALAEIVKDLASPFKSVFGVLTGGAEFAKALRPYVSEKGINLIVDDVMTTGWSMEREKESLVEMGFKPDNILGIVIFSRVKDYADWIHPLFEVNFDT